MSIMKKIDYKSSGFTFLEIAIALAIISIAFVSLTTLFNTTMGLADYTDKMTIATFLAQKIMTEAELEEGFSLGEGELVELEDEYEGYSYKINVVETPLPFIQEVNLTVYYESILREHSLTVTSYIAASLIDGAGGEESSGGGEEQ